MIYLIIAKKGEVKTDRLHFKFMTVICEHIIQFLYCEGFLSTDTAFPISGVILSCDQPQVVQQHYNTSAFEHVCGFQILLEKCSHAC